MGSRTPEQRLLQNSLINTFLNVLVFWGLTVEGIHTFFSSWGLLCLGCLLSFQGGCQDEADSLTVSN